MQVFVSSLNVPIGYTVPKFPSLHFPGSSDKFTELYLYYSFDMWLFTVFWTLIFYGGIYIAVGLWAAFNIALSQSRKSLNNTTANSKIVSCLAVLASYTFVGLVQGFIAGAAVGVLLLAIYKAGSLAMTTWIPFCWGVASILFNICSAYRTSSLIL